jgi:hypothetical protein
VCPVDAIFKDIDIPAEHAASIEVNAGFFRRHKAVRGPVPVQSAWEMVHRAHAYAEANGLKVAAVVVDEAGCPIAVGRMDGADPNAAELAFNKAYTAAAFQVATAELVPSEWPVPIAPSRTSSAARPPSPSWKAPVTEGCRQADGLEAEGDPHE